MSDTGLPSRDLYQDLLRGLLYTHNRANANTAEVHLACATIHAVVELLLERGVLNREELARRQDAASDTLRRQYVERGMGVAMQEFGVSKYAFQAAPEIDCASRIQLCHAACCKLPLALSKEDIEEGSVSWELGQPYMLAHDSDGYCAHHNRETHGCGIYAQRPIPCRGYDCRNDQRIWLDFEKAIPNPDLTAPAWPNVLMEHGAADVESRP